MALSGGEYSDLSLKRPCSYAGCNLSMNFARGKQMDEAILSTDDSTTLTEAANEGGEVDPTSA